MTGSHHAGKKWFTCPGCGKRAYGSRRDAKTALRNHPTPGGMHTYRCIDTPAAGRSFTADDVRRELPTETIAWLSENGSRLGNCFKSAKARGSIRKAGWRNSSRVIRHGNVNTIWEGARP